MTKIISEVGWEIIIGKCTTTNWSVWIVFPKKKSSPPFPAIDQSIRQLRINSGEKLIFFKNYAQTWFAGK